MTGILASIENLISSILSTIAGLFNTLLSSLQGVLSVIATALGSVVDLLRGAVELVLGNIVIIGALFAGVVGWSVYQQRRGNIQQGSTLRAKKRA